MRRGWKEGKEERGESGLKADEMGQKRQIRITSLSGQICVLTMSLRVLTLALDMLVI